MVHIYSGRLLSHNSERMPFAATWMKLEIILLTEVGERKTNTCDIIYMWNLKCDANELIDETEQNHRHGEQTSGFQGEGGS